VQLATEEVVPLIVDALDEVRPAATSRGITLVLHAGRVGPVAADRQRVHQVLTNLLGNGVKFTPRGGRVDVHVEPFDGRVRVTVRDSGPGIAPRDLPHVFERFWQGPTTARGGNGLGLYIVKTLVEAQGGSVSVESELGAGTSFGFTLCASSQPGVASETL
jgi:signal transduction histidine kinase